MHTGKKTSLSNLGTQHEPSRILIVEDEKLIALSLKSLVESLGYPVVEILETGESAIEFLEKNPVEIVLMDIKLGSRMDGITAAEIIHKNYGIPFIYISAFSDSEIIERAKKTRPFGYLIKPFDKRNLNTTLELALYRHKAEKMALEYEQTRYAFLKAVPDLVFLRITSEGIILELNLPEKFPIPINAGDLTGKSLADVPAFVKGLDEDTVSESLRLIREVFRTKKEAKMEFRIRSEFKNYYFESQLILVNHKEAICVIRDITKRKKAEADLLEAIVKTQDNERHRFATDLHDSLGQILTAAKLNMDSLSAEADKLTETKNNNLNSAQKLLANAIHEARVISHGLMPEVLSSFGLEAALEELCSTFLEAGKIKITFNSHKFDKSTNPEIQVGLFRIAQELLNNAVKHSHASEIHVQLIRNRRKMTLMVEDNGKGLSKDPHQWNGHGMGMRNVTARVTLLSGEFNIDSDMERGTTVTVEVPLNP